MRHGPVIRKYPYLLHGGDYNPEQWIDTPEVWDEDFRLMRLSRCNAMSVGIFSWAMYEPEEGKFEFGWLDKIMDRLAENNMKAVLATPSGAKPNWMAMKYPEIKRCTPDGHREPQKHRHNHCYTSPIYREKVRIINSKLAERYQKHPALGLWHLSNEYSGECYCDLCKKSFREWLKRKYGTLDKLNHAWWSTFWSHRYTDWDQIDWIDRSVHGLVIDWKRFVSDQTTDFLRAEKEILKKWTPDVPVTTNMMGTFFPLDYRRQAKELDVICWDNYPAYHDRNNMVDIAVRTSFTHDLNRSMKFKPFLMMESSPSAVNWDKINKLLRPGIHRLKSLQAVAHGSDSVQYFQWRKSRGSSEKFHGAVVDHCGHEHTRVFGDVADVGKALENLAGVVGADTPVETAIIFDWENRWILEEVQGPRKEMHENFVLRNYKPFWQMGIPVDVIGMDDDCSKYKLLIAPMLYMLKPGAAERLNAFVKKGGTLVATFLTGIADENDLSFLGGWPGPLRKMLGIWAEEIDYLYDDESNTVVMNKKSGLKGKFKSTLVCDLIHAETAEVLATYGKDFYAGRPALTRNLFGAGKAYYLATVPDPKFFRAFYEKITAETGIKRVLNHPLPAGVTAQIRTDGEKRFVFLMNFNKTSKQIRLGAGKKINVLTGQAIRESVTLEGYGVAVIRMESESHGA